MADDTYYSLLEVSEAAAAAEIKTAYIRLIRDVHPDRLANAPAYWQRQAEEKSKEINEAYATLSNPSRRRLYDAQLSAYRSSQSATGRQGTPQASTAASRSTQAPPSASQQHQAPPASTQPTNAPTQSSGQPSASEMTAGQRFFLALVGCAVAFVAAVAFWADPSAGEDAFPFLLAAALLFGVTRLYKNQISRMFLALRVRRGRQQLWATIGIIVLVLFAGKIANMSRDTHFRGPDDHAATSSQVSQVKIIDGSLSTTTVSGYSNEQYPSAYNFTGYIQNNSAVEVYFVRMKIRIFDCPETESQSSHTSYGITYESGIYDPSPPSSCKNIGEEEEDDFPEAEPGQTLGFANFYFPNRPQGGLRWNYEITKMNTQSRRRF